MLTSKAEQLASLAATSATGAEVAQTDGIGGMHRAMNNAKPALSLHCREEYFE